MKKLLKWHDAYTLKILVAFLIVFVALYPKLPSIHIIRTWVYIRLEDFFILGTTVIWFIQLLRHKVAFPRWIGFGIGLYWLVGLASVIFSLVFIAPTLLNFFPHLEILAYLRRIEYMILFFVAFSTITSVKDVKQYLIILSITLSGVLFYGFGQRYYLIFWSLFPDFFQSYSFCFPSFQTGNEEFAKGIPLCLPDGSRITSTFGGHYDLAAYLVIILPIFLALFLSFKKVFMKILLGGLFLSGLLLLIFTASRVSFGAYVVGVITTLVLYQKKLYIIPVIVISLLIMFSLSNSTAQRFLSTVRVSSIVTDSQGQLVGEVSSNLPDSLKRKISGGSQTDANGVLIRAPQPAQKLPQGSAFIGLPSQLRKSPSATSTAFVQKTLTPEETRRLQLADGSLQLSTVSGNFTVRQALVYDISFTTRFQSEWPHAWDAFMRNPFLGSGYATITLATDNDYIRALGETGILGLFAFIFIFIVLGITFSSLVGSVKDPVIKGFSYGLAGGVIGLACNAVLIDVFEASKVAESLWLLLGIGVGGLFVATKKEVPYLKKLQAVFTSHFFLGVYLFLILAIVFSPSLSNFFIADDFVWLYWAANATLPDIAHYFIDSQNFFYRPLDKALVVVLYNFFAFQPSAYHLFTLLLHFLTTIAVYLFASKLLKNKLLSFAAALIFLLHPIHSEVIYWFSTVSITLGSLWIMAALNSFLSYRERSGFFSGVFYLFAFLASLLAFISYEIAVVIPFLLLSLDVMIIRTRSLLRLFVTHLPFFLLLPAYAMVRTLTNTFNGGGDYSYSLPHLVPNVLGNFFGYIGLFVIGQSFFPVYDVLRGTLRGDFILFSILSFVILFILGWGFYSLRRPIKHYVTSEYGSIVLFGIVFAFIALTPFLALGNIAERYLYLGSVGLCISAVILLHQIITVFFSPKSKQYLVILFAIILIFSWFSYQGLQRENSKWSHSGELTKTTLSLFRTDFPLLTESDSLYFVNTPVKYNGVWVFPVGLPEGLWFIYGKNTPHIFQVSSIEESKALMPKPVPPQLREFYIFQFSEDGILSEVQ